MSTWRICCCRFCWICSSTILITFITFRSGSTLSIFLIVASFIPQIIHHWVTLSIIFTKVMFWSMVMTGSAVPVISAVERVREQTCSAAVDPLVRRGTVPMLCCRGVLFAVIWVVTWTISALYFILVHAHEEKITVGLVQITCLGDHTPQYTLVVLKTWGRVSFGYSLRACVAGATIRKRCVTLSK